jgi:hypothetical protein
MLTRFTFYRFVEGWQQRRAAPIVDDSITFGHTIEVRPYDDDPVGAARQEADDVGQLRSLHRLFGNVLVVATGFSKHLLERCLTLLVFADVFSQSGFNDFTRNRIVPDVLSSGADREIQHQYDGRSGGRLPPLHDIRHSIHARNSIGL